MGIIPTLLQMYANNKRYQNQRQYVEHQEKKQERERERDRQHQQAMMQMKPQELSTPKLYDPFRIYDQYYSQ